MTELLDTQVAERIIAECRDAEATARFQRASYIVETLLDGLGLRQVAKELRRRRIECGEIDRYAAAAPAPIPAAVDEPASHQHSPGLVLPGPAPGEDVLTGRKRKRVREEV